MYTSDEQCALKDYARNKDDASVHQVCIHLTTTLISRTSTHRPAQRKKMTPGRNRMTCTLYIKQNKHAGEGSSPKHKASTKDEDDAWQEQRYIYSVHGQEQRPPLPIILLLKPCQHCPKNAEPLHGRPTMN